MDSNILCKWHMAKQTLLSPDSILEQTGPLNTADNWTCPLISVRYSELPDLSADYSRPLDHTPDHQTCPLITAD